MTTDSYIILRPGEYEELSEHLQSRFINEHVDTERVDEGDKYYFEHDIFHEILEELEEEGWGDEVIE